MTKDEALKLALDALEGFIPYLPLKDEAQCNSYDKAITALRLAIDAQSMASKSTYKEQLETKDEPVALVAEVHISRYTIEWTNGPLPQGTKLYTTPQRKPLTDEHIDEIPFALFEQDQNGISATEALREFARAIEAAHGIKE